MKYKGKDTSLAFPSAIFNIGYNINPIAIPSAILYVKGIIAIIKMLGKLTLISFKSRWRIFCSISPPIMIKIGAMALFGIIFITGMKNAEQMNNNAVVMDVSPVFPPAVMLAVLSTVATVGLLPNTP